MQKPSLDIDGSAAAGVHETTDAPATDDAMAGNQNGEMVSSASRANRTRRRSDAVGHLRVRAHRSHGYGTNGLPHLDLEFGTIIVERQIKIEIRLLKIRRELSANLSGERRLRPEQRCSSREIVDANQPLADSTHAEDREWRFHLCLPGLQQGIQGLRRVCAAAMAILGARATLLANGPTQTSNNTAAINIGPSN
jgi:hypothetical protein